MSNKITFEKVCAIFIIALISIGIYAFYLKIYIPAKMSYDYVCLNNVPKENVTVESMQNDSEVLGYYNSSSDEVYVRTNITINNTVYQIKEEYIEDALRHETCHQNQNIKGRHYGCDRKLLKIRNEMECYLAEKYPDWMYKIIY